jgi:hypothetical protein
MRGTLRMPFLPYYDHIDPGQGGSAMVIPELPRTILDEPQVFNCPICQKVFGSYDDRFQHRFEAHPYRRPLLVLGAHEVITPRFIVTRALKSEQIHLINATTCRLDGRTISAEALASHIGGARSGFFRVELTGAGGKMSVHYEISVEITSDSDALLVEQEFARLYSPGVVSVCSINGFIRATAEARTARRYVDGLASYLYGVIAKDQRGDTMLSQEQGRARLFAAVQTLSEIDRPLATVVAGIVGFQSNAFSHHAQLTTVPKLQSAMRWFDVVKRTGVFPAVERKDRSTAPNAQVPLDSATDEILAWTDMAPSRLSDSAKYVAKRRLQDDWLAEDRIKARVMLAFIYQSNGDAANAVEIAREFRHDQVFGRLAERLIQ